MKVAEKQVSHSPTPEEKKAIPDVGLKYPSSHVPPKGLEAYQISKDGSYWSVWKISVLDTGTLETTKVLEREPFALARLRAAQMSIEWQMRQIK